MPARKGGRKAIKNVTLYETLNWIAFDNIAGPDPHPEEIRGQIGGLIDDLEGLELELWNREQDREEAEEDLFAALIDGDIGARGRFSKTNTRSSSPVDWMNQEYVGHADTRTEIPADFWRREGIDWKSSNVKSTSSEYVDIVLSCDDVFACWPLEDSNGDTPSQDPIPSKKGEKRGRKKQYNDREFLALSVWDAHADSLPEKQSEFVEKMALLLAIVWGEDRVPGETWLKAQVSYIYSLKAKHEHGRQAREKQGISDRPETPA